MTASQFTLTAEQQSLLDHADRFGREQLLPHVARMDNEEWWPQDVFKQFDELGFLG